MSKISKTAKASLVQEKHEKKVITDEELIRQLRINRAAKLYPLVQEADALLRAYDVLLESNKALVESHQEVSKQLEEMGQGQIQLADDIAASQQQVKELQQQCADLIAENARLVNRPCEEEVSEADDAYGDPSATEQESWPGKEAIAAAVGERILSDDPGRLDELVPEGPVTWPDPEPKPPQPFTREDDPSLPLPADEDGVRR